jgi:hypothetical protein
MNIIFPRAQRLLGYFYVINNLLMIVRDPDCSYWNPKIITANIYIGHLYQDTNSFNAMFYLEYLFRDKNHYVDSYITQ